jgi:hypothetical protein
MAATNIQTFAGNIGIGTNDPGSYKLNVFGSVKATSLEVNGVENAQVPIGMIAMWYGTVATKPAGWEFCDGGTYTRTDGGGSIVAPDLRSKFVRCAQGDAPASPNPGQAAGQNTVTLTETELPTHTHTASSSSQDTHTHDTTITGGQHAHPGSSSSQDTHTHDTTITGGQHAHPGSSSSQDKHSHDVTIYGGQHAHPGSSSSQDKHSHESFTGYVTSDHSRVHVDGAAPPVRNDAMDIWQNGFVGGDPALVKQAIQHRHAIELNQQGAHGHQISVGETAQHSHQVKFEQVGAHGHQITVGETAQHSHQVLFEQVGAHGHQITVGETAQHSHQVQFQNVGAHGHQITVDNTGSGAAFSIVPAYYTLAYIMKI